MKNYIMSDDTFVFDSYALMEIINGNENYNYYINKKIIINDFIFAELCYVLTREGYPNAERYFDRYSKFIIHASPDAIKKAMKFRFLNKKKRMSITDCISYFMAKELGIKFLTGDKEFEDLGNVEFVPK